MDDLDNIIEPTLFITTVPFKNQLLTKFSKKGKIVPVKFMTMEEFLENYFFRVKKEAYFYLLKREKQKISIIEEAVKYLPFLVHPSYQSKKLNHLKEILEDLEKNHLLERNPYFHSYLEMVKVVVYGYQLAPFYQELFRQFNAKIMESKLEKKEIQTVYQFSDIEEEVGFVGGEILHKIKEGIPLEKIKILSLFPEYRNPIRRIFRLLHIPIDIEEESKIFETFLGKATLKYLEEEESLEKLVERLKNEFPNTIEIDDIIHVLNEYTWHTGTPIELKELIENDFKKVTFPRNYLKNCIECINLEQIEEDDYYFLLGFNQENVPKVYKNEDFLSDSEKTELGLFTSDEQNKVEKDTWKRILSGTPHLTITYKKKSAFNPYNPSLLIEELNLAKKEMSSSYLDSNLYNQVLLARYLDQLNKYGIIARNLNQLYYTYSQVPYMTYRNQFTGIQKEELSKFLKQKLTLSYSHINNFYKCSFRYYLSNILKIDPFESTFSTNIGNVFHGVLEHSLEPNFDFDETFRNEVESYEFSDCEKFLLNKLRDELLFDIEILKKQKEHTTFQKELHEEVFVLPISKDEFFETSFKGIVDKIMYLEEGGHTYLAIIDYKTGQLPTNLNHVIYGIGMQLPVYLYLVNHSKKFSSPKVVGIFLQRMINKEIKRQRKKDYKAERENSLKLEGFAIDEEELLEKFDDSYENSSVIRSLRKTKNGFYAYSKVLNQEKFEKLENIVEEKIKEADGMIRNADFKINPKRIGKDLIGCQYCKFQDICFRREEDIVSFKEYKKLDFLGGEEDAELDEGTTGSN